MRQYRGLTKDGKWVYGWYAQVEEKHFIVTDESRLDYEEDYNVIFRGLIEVIPESVGQSTGLKDKNGKEVYGGDILHIWSKFYEKDMPIAEVFWNEKYAKFDIKVLDGLYHDWLPTGHHPGWFIEIIGNKWNIQNY